MTDASGYRTDLVPEELEFQRLYGPWDPFDVDQAAAALGDELTWWVTGGVAVEAFTGVPRHHEDIDISLLRRDLPILRSVVHGRFHVWAAAEAGLTPLADGRPMPEGAEQVWLREHALAPWRADMQLNTDAEGRWQFKRDPHFSAPVEAVTWIRNGIRYLNPELVLAHKARLSRPKDDADLAAALPLLDDAQRTFLRDFLERCEPAHPWRARLAEV